MVSSFRHLAKPLAKEAITTDAEKGARALGRKLPKEMVEQTFSATKNLPPTVANTIDNVMKGPSDADSIAKGFGDVLDESDNAKNIQNLNDAIHPSGELTEVDHLKVHIENATDSQKRGLFGKVLGGAGDEAAEMPKAGYAQASQFAEEKVRDTGRASGRGREVEHPTDRGGREVHLRSGSGEGRQVQDHLSGQAY